MSSLSQRFVISGVFNRAGKAKQSGNSYSMYIGFILQPIPVEGTVVSANGFRPVEMQLSEMAYARLKDAKLPMEFDCAVSMNDRAQLQIVDVTLPTAASKAA